MAAIAGLRGTGDWATDERPKNFREMILWREQRGTAPVLALSSKANKEAVSDPEFAWWDEPLGIVRLQVNGALTSSATTVVVDSADPSTSAPGINYGTASHLVPGDLLMREDTTENVGYTNEIIEVVQVLSDTQFVVNRGAAGTTAASINNDDYLTLLGSSFAEGTSAPSAVSRNPMKYSNYCQIFKTSYEITGTADVTATRTGDTRKNDKKRRMWDHARGIEMSIIWGKKNETTGSNGKPKRTTGGIRSQIPSTNVTIWSAAVSAFDFLDAVYKVFDYESPAGDERVIFCGNTFLNELNKIVLSSGEMSWAGEVSQFGMNLTRLRVPQGSFFLKTHPIFNQHSAWKKSGLVMDFSALRWRHTAGRDTQFKDDVQNKDEDVRRGFWFTEGGVELWYGGLTCAYLSNLSAT